MSDDFANMFRRALAHPRCRGVTFFPTSDGCWQVSIAIDKPTNWNVNVDANALMALWRCMERLRINA